MSARRILWLLAIAALLSACQAPPDRPSASRPGAESGSNQDTGDVLRGGILPGESLRQLCTSIPDGVTVEEVRIDGARVRLSGSAQDHHRIARFLLALQQSPWCSNLSPGPIVGPGPCRFDLAYTRVEPGDSQDEPSSALLPPSSEAGQAVGRLGDLASASGLSVLSCIPQEVRPVAGLGRMPVLFQATGGCPSIAAFLDALRKEPPLWSAPEIRLERREGKDGGFVAILSLSATFDLQKKE